MNNSLFPIEVCEYIIDSCRAGLRGGSNVSYATWCQTALVCSAWLPRSRFNLFYEVELTADSHVGLLLRTLQETPHFADMVAPECSLVSWPVSAFGGSVKSLDLDVNRGVSVSTLQCIESFSTLAHLKVACKLDDPLSDPDSNTAISPFGARKGTLRSILASVRSGSALLSITVMVWPSDNDSHGVDRAGLVDLLVGGEMQGILGQFPELRQLHFTLVDNDSKYDAGWWSSEMIRRLPDSCRAAVSVDVILWPREQHLWRTQEEIEATRRESRE
ncbi:hypothetical protein C8Q76DRAFT_798167 [Earliella scabrosa]|nr:hypothetical protein C8Q76DRAFT_798167 [Earliella scabrosa]